MTDNEIIKALKATASWVCDECTFHGEMCDGDECEKVIAKNALALINHQKAEIERLREIANPKCQKCVSRTIECAKSEAIKEFAHFVIDRSRDGVVYLSDIPDLVKEMTEVNENGSN